METLSAELSALPLDATALLIAISVTALGAFVQAALGFGLALIAAPILILLYPPLVPGPLMAASIVLTLLVAYRDRAAIDFHGIAFAMGGRVVGTIAAAAFLAVASQAAFDLAFGLLVLAGVGLSLAGLHLAPGPRSAVVAGGLSGLMGTVSSIGGPPMALLYQSEGGPRLRGTLAGFFVLGTLLSLVALAAVGRFAFHEATLSLVLVPPMLIGFSAAGPLLGHLDATRVRPAVLGLSFVSGVAVLWRALV